MSVKRFIGRVLAALIICSGFIYPIATPAFADPLVNVTDNLSDYSIGHTSSHTISFTLATELESNDKIVIDFPGGFNVSGASLGTVTAGGVSANFSLSVNAQRMMLNKNGSNSVSAGTLISVLLNGIINILTPGDYHITVTTTHSNGITAIDGPTDSNSFSITSSGTSTPTTTTLVSSDNPSLYGQSVAFTASVIPSDAPGIVQFRIDGADFGSPVSLSGGEAASSSIATLTAGNHSVTAEYGGDTNYEASTGTTTQTVNKATPTITWSNPADITYPAPLSSTQLNATASVPGSFTYNPTDGTILDAGSNQALNVTLTPTDAANYIPANATVYLNVVGGSATISLSGLNHSYDGNSKSASVTTSPPGLSYSITFDGSATPPTDAGNYAVVATITEPGYSGSDNDTLAISPAPLTMAADAKNKVYGQADPLLTYNITSGILFPGDTISGALTRTVGEDAGSYAILRGSLTAGSNYTLTYTGANLTITRASATVTLGNLNQTYNGSAKSASVTTSPPGLTSSKTYNGSATLPVNAGSYAVVATVTDPNYTGTDTGTLVISQAPLTITASAKSKIYGQTNPALTWAITSGSLFGSDSTTGVLTRAAGENVGTYAIQQGTLSAGVNYDLTFVGADFEITRATLTVRADNASRAYGDPNPAFTASYSGFVNGDEASDLSGALLLSTTATSTSPVGSYPISVAQGTLNSPNYTFNFVNGTLTIGSNVITVTANPQSKVFGDPDPALTYSAPNDITFTGALERDNGENVGSYNINQGTLSAGADYTISFVVADLTITKATPVITWNNPASITQGTVLSATQLNAVTGVPGTLVYTPPIGTVLNVGDNQTLHVEFTPADNSNYNTASRDVNISVSSAGGGGPGGGDLGGGFDTGTGGGGGGGSSDKTYLSTYMKETPGVFSEDVSLKAWDGICNLVIPKNTRGKTAEGWAVSYITFEPVPGDKQTVPPPAGGNIVGLTYSLGPEGTTFDPPITMNMLYFPEKLPAGVKDSDLVIGYWNSTIQKWEPLSGCKVDSGKHTLSAPLSHFSTYAVLGVPPAIPVVTAAVDPKPASTPVVNTPENNGGNIINPPPSIVPPPSEPQQPGISIVVTPQLSPAIFSLNTPVFSSTRASPGQQVSICVLVTNKGEMAGDYTLTLKVNGDVTETRQVTVPGQSNQSVDFTFTKNQSGRYLVDINGISGVIEIPSFLPGWLLPISVTLAILVFGITIFVIIRKSSRLGFQLP